VSERHEVYELPVLFMAYAGLRAGKGQGLEGPRRHPDDCPGRPREDLSSSEFQHVSGPPKPARPITPKPPAAVANRATGVDLVTTKPAVYPPRT
jgi:hypothetical protein